MPNSCKLTHWNYFSFLELSLSNIETSKLNIERGKEEANKYEIVKENSDEGYFQEDILYNKKGKTITELIRIYKI